MDTVLLTYKGTDITAKDIDGLHNPDVIMPVCIFNTYTDYCATQLSENKTTQVHPLTSRTDTGPLRTDVTAMGKPLVIMPINSDIARSCMIAIVHTSLKYVDVYVVDMHTDAFSTSDYLSDAENIFGLIRDSIKDKRRECRLIPPIRPTDRQMADIDVHALNIIYQLLVRYDGTSDLAEFIRGVEPCGGMQFRRNFIMLLNRIALGTQQLME